MDHDHCIYSGGSARESVIGWSGLDWDDVMWVRLAGSGLGRTLGSTYLTRGGYRELATD